MTPELKTACELVFQEHKLSRQIKWTKDSFRGQLSIGLSELAKETLVKKNIIFLPNKSKKLITLLNPAVETASSFEEAEGMAGTESAFETITHPKVASIQTPVPGPKEIPMPRHSKKLVPVLASPAPAAHAMKWYLKPVFFYFVWPVCAIAAGALVSFLLDFAFSELFLHTK